MSKYEIRDPIYGFINFSEFEKNIIDSPPFQRLRRIQQLALTHFVYPGATHTRFSHSLGVMHMASLMFDAILDKKQNREILKEEFEADAHGRMRKIVRLAALLHDVGHAPFSHAAESAMPIKEKDNKYKHEDYTTAIIEGPFKAIFEGSKYNSDGIRVEEVTDLIEGKSTCLGAWGIFWKSLISSQLDADRADYLLRDSHHCGVRYGIYDYQRLINSLELGYDPDSETVKLGINKESWQIAEAFVLARYQISTQVYYHKTRRAFDFHLKNALDYLYNDNPFPKPNEIEDYLLIDENEVWEKIKQEKDKNKDCGAIFYRNQIRPVFSTNEKKTSDDIQKMEKLIVKLKENDIYHYIDNLDQDWYKKDGKKLDQIEPKEIMVIDNIKRNASPLAVFSVLLENIFSFNQSRLYVEPDKKEDAIKIIRDLK